MKRVAAVSICIISALMVFALTGCAGARAFVANTNGNTAGPLTAKTFIMQDLFAGDSDVLNDSATVLIYMNGSDLESYSGEATMDIAEMIDSGIGDNVNVVIETLGTSEWRDYGIASDHSQRYVINNGRLKLVDDSLGQLDTTDPDTLSDFIAWGVDNYPADRYMLIFWDHGAGPVYGFGYDEFQGDYAALTLDEIQSALQENSSVHFDMIGMDCCLMSSLEICCVLAPFCDYAILSEDFEPGLGWRYENWMSMLEDDPSINMVDLGTAIVDDMVDAVAADSANGDATLALIDESVMPVLYAAWVDFAYQNESSLLGENYSLETESQGRAPFGGGFDWSGGPGGGSTWGGGQGGGYGWGDSNWEDMFNYWDYDSSYVTMSDYYVTDIMAVASTIDTDASKALASAVDNTIVHYACTSGEVGMTGMGVTLPYGDAEFYDELVRVFSACGFDSSYIEWLELFVDASGADDFYDYSEFEDLWSGWDSYSNGFDWIEWALGNEDYWGEYEDSGWYDQWYDDYGGGWLDFFFDSWASDPQW